MITIKQLDFGINYAIKRNKPNHSTPGIGKNNSNLFTGLNLFEVCK